MQHDERSAGLIVYESSGRWALALARHLPELRGRLQETRSPDECLTALAGAPASFVVVELTQSGADAGLRLLRRCVSSFPAAAPAVVVERGLDFDEWTLRELGAVHVIRSRRRVRSLAEMAGRHLRRYPSSSRSPWERALAELPWNI